MSEIYGIVVGDRFRKERGPNVGMVVEVTEIEDPGPFWGAAIVRAKNVDPGHWCGGCKHSVDRFEQLYKKLVTTDA